MGAAVPVPGSFPAEPFPHVNETDDFKKRIKLMKRLALVPWVLGAAALVRWIFPASIAPELAR